MRTGEFSSPGSGVLLARRAVAAVVESAISEGVDYFQEFIAEPTRGGKITAVRLPRAERFMLRNLFLLVGRGLRKFSGICFAERIFVTRQEVYFFGVPAGDRRFAPPAMPGWLFQADLTYGVPDLESRGFKIALDCMDRALIPIVIRVCRRRKNCGDAELFRVGDFLRWQMRRWLRHEFVSTKIRRMEIF